MYIIQEKDNPKNVFKLKISLNSRWEFQPTINQIKDTHVTPTLIFEILDGEDNGRAIFYNDISKEEWGCYADVERELNIFKRRKWGRIFC